MPGKEHKADEAAIRRLDEEWGNAATAKNLDAVVGFYAGDGSLVWPEQRAVPWYRADSHQLEEDDACL
jgi:ketosteroid isomerase-like protein